MEADAAGGPSIPGRVVLVSNHHVQSPRRAGFHHLAEAYLGLGWDVRFLTTGLSPVSVLRRDPRMALARAAGLNRLRTIRPGLAVYAWFTPWHPANLRNGVLNHLTSPLASSYGRLPFRHFDEVFGGAHVVLFESGPGLFLVRRVRAALPAARLVYRQSDDLRAVEAHPAVIAAESRAFPALDLVSVTDELRVTHLPAGVRAVVHRHGVDRDAFDRDSERPYPEGTRNAVFVGVDGLDRVFLACAADAFPDWTFHVVGPFPPRPRRTNLVFHGEMPFARTIPFVTHADVGLHTIDRPMPENFRESLKVLQYTYARLPVVAPRRAAAAHPHVIAYEPGDAASMIRAMERAAGFPRESIDRGIVRTWRETAADIARDAGR